MALGSHLLTLAEGRGVRLMRGEVTGVECAGGRVRAVTVSTRRGTERISTPRLVNAAGPFVTRVAGLLGISLPVSTVLQQKVAFADPHGAVPGDAPFTISLDPQPPLPAGLHIKADDGSNGPLVKIGWAYNQSAERPEWEPAGSPEFARRVLVGAARVIPGLQAYALAGAKPVAHDAGYYVKAPDELPIIGRLGVEGAYVVGALAGFGGMVGCAAGEIAAAWITGCEQPEWALDFVPDRFTRSGTPSVAAATPSGAL
jgi:glycine/D-amino acid oxidase-like deaminating enzyme